MKLLDIFLTASSNMFRAKLRTSLTVIAIFIGAFTLTITSGIGAGVSGYIDRQLGNLGAKDVLLVSASDSSAGPGTGSSAPKKYDPARKTQSSGSPRGNQTLLSTTDLSKIQATSGVISVHPTRYISTDYIAGTQSDKYQASLASNVRGTHLDLAAGSNLDDSALLPQVVVPLSYLADLGFTSASEAIGKPVVLAVTDATGLQHTLTATVSGVQQQGILGGSNVVANAATTDQLYTLQSTGLPAATRQQYLQIEAKITANLSSDQVTKLKSTLKDEGYSAQTVQDQIGTFKTVINGIIGVLDAFAVIALLAASFGIINTLLMAVQERTKEIGLMKSMGMSSGRIFLLFSAEAIMIGFWGSVLGVAVAYGIGTIANQILSKGFLKDLPGLNIVAFPPTSIATIILIIMLIAFLAGTLPASSAAKQSPIDALRYE
jgi:putative ABC transport system permease protein